MRRRRGHQALIALLLALSTAWADENVVEVIGTAPPRTLSPSSFPSPDPTPS